MKLFSYWRSSCSWRVRIVLAAKGIDYEYVPVHLVRDGGDQNRQEYAALNPLRQVPALQWSEAGETRTLTQSMAICEYLDATFPSPRMIPDTPLVAARVREACEIVNAGIQPHQNLSVGRRVKELAPSVDVSAWNAEWIRKGFVSLEALLERTAGSRSIGDETTLADAFLAPQVYNAHRHGVNMDEFPTIARVHSQLEALPAFVTAHPNNQPDRPEES